MRTIGKNHGELTAGVLAALARIGEQCEGADVLVTARRNADIGKAGDDGGRGSAIDWKTIRRFGERSGVRVKRSTIHKAKGTEADYVIFLDTGPPRAREAARNRAVERALEVFRGADAPEDEERRIWYVALTRARRKVYLIVAAGTGRPSAFADELLGNADGRYDVGGDEFAELLEPLRPLVPCPVCGPKSAAVLTVREGPSGRFASCTSFGSGPDHACGFSERVCDACNERLMVRLGNGRARCDTPGCGWEAPLCRCDVPRPMAVRQNGTTGERFWGCQRFGMEGSCKATRRLGEADWRAAQRTHRGRSRTG